MSKTPWEEAQQAHAPSLLPHSTSGLPPRNMFISVVSHKYMHAPASPEGSRAGLAPMVGPVESLLITKQQTGPCTELGSGRLGQKQQGQHHPTPITRPCCYEMPGCRSCVCLTLPVVPGRIPGLRFLGWLLGFSASLHGRSWNNSENFCRACGDDVAM